MAQALGLLAGALPELQQIVEAQHVLVMILADANVPRVLLADVQPRASGRRVTQTPTSPLPSSAPSKKFGVGTVLTMAWRRAIAAESSGTAVAGDADKARAAAVAAAAPPRKLRRFMATILRQR
jgi:hypothetical protein